MLSMFLWKSIGAHPWVQRNWWDILGFADVRWTGFGETTTDEGHKIWYCGEDSKHQYGVAFIAWKEVEGSIINCTPIFSRLFSNQISAREQTKATVIQVNAPTSDHESKQVEQFCEQLDSIIARTPNKDTCSSRRLECLSRLGCMPDWAGAVERFGTGETNDREWRLLEFTKSHPLTLANSLHLHKLSRTATWHAPNGQVHN